MIIRVQMTLRVLSLSATFGLISTEPDKLLDFLNSEFATGAADVKIFSVLNESFEGGEINMLMETDELFGLPEGKEVEEVLAALHLHIETLGVNVVDDFSPPNHARFVGIFEDNTITLYPNSAPSFARWFTIAHLYGHMIQLLNETPRVLRANSLVLRLGETLVPEDVQVVYDHEREAAEIGRKLVALANPTLSLEMDKAYYRFFHADFRYLINVIETAESGTELFALYWKREPIPRELIAPDPRPLVDFKQMPESDDRIVVV